MPKPDNIDQVSRADLNLETSRIAWRELLRFFAAGTVVAVDAGLDLIEVAYQMSQDNKTLVEQWLAQGALAKVSDRQAQLWLESDALLWTVVVKPWILVQPDAAA